MKKFLDEFEKRSKLEQDSILFTALQDAAASSRKDYYFLGKHMRRSCFEALMGVSSHRVDRIGCVDKRFGKRPTAPTHLSTLSAWSSTTASLSPCLTGGLSVLASSKLFIPLFSYSLCNSGCFSVPLRLVRQGPAKWKKTTKAIRQPTTGSDTDHWRVGGMVHNSEFEDNDEDLAKHLQDFILGATQTAAFTALWLCSAMFCFNVMCFGRPLKFN